MENRRYIDWSAQLRTAQPLDSNLISYFSGRYSKINESIILESMKSLEILTSADSSSITSSDGLNDSCSSVANSSIDSLLGYKSLEILNRTEILQRSTNHKLSSSPFNPWCQSQYPPMLLVNRNSTREAQFLPFRDQSTFNDPPLSSKMSDSMILPYNHSYRKGIKVRSSTSKMKPIAATEAKQFCTFCRTNNEEVSLYSAHLLRNPKTHILECPVLRKLVCPQCGATGDQAHTLTYCPHNRSSNGAKQSSVFCHIKKSRRLASGKLRT